MAIVIVGVKVFGRKPEKRYKWEAMKEDVELGNSVYPMVLVQIPMYNEREVYQLSIGAACGLSWPSDRIIIQVLDDSTDPVIKVTLGTWKCVFAQSSVRKLKKVVVLMKIYSQHFHKIVKIKIYIYHKQLFDIIKDTS